MGVLSHALPLFYKTSKQVIFSCEFICCFHKHSILELISVVVFEAQKLIQYHTRKQGKLRVKKRKTSHRVGYEKKAVEAEKLIHDTTQVILISKSILALLSAFRDSETTGVLFYESWL